ncbi:MAG: hemolysin family protein [Verrucomicrobiales bacterium]
MSDFSSYLFLADVVRSPITGSELVWQLVLIFLFILLNGFFVAAEFALVKVRISQLDEVINGEATRRHIAGAKLARHIISQLDAYLSACQLGITIASLVLGALGEPFVHRLIEPWLGEGGLGLGERWVRGISWFTAIASITALHVVLGEQMPKTLAIRKALGTSLFVGRPLQWFYALFRPVIWLLNGAAIGLLRLVFRVEPVEDANIVHSSEELRMLVTQSGKEEEVTETERDILINALELNDRIVRDIMTPRGNVMALDIHKDFQTNLRIAIESKHTRFPLIDGHLDTTIGLVHIKDILGIINEPSSDLQRIKRELHAVPELTPLDKLLKFFLSKHAHLAVVVDEFGAVNGIVSLDDVIEELVGEIQDEFDTEEKRFQRLDDAEFLVDGTFSLYELAERTDLELESDDVSTIGGYLTDLFGHLPSAGEKTEVDGYEVTVTKTDGRRIVQVHFKRRPEPVNESASPSGETADPVEPRP